MATTVSTTTRRKLSLRLAVLALALLAGGSTAAMARGGDDGESRAHRNSCGIRGRDRQAISTAKLIIEFNAGDGDLGVHGQFDDDGWSRLCVLDPRGRRLLDVDPRRQLDHLGLGSIFFESREPELEEFGFQQLARRFPEGTYRVYARSVEGTVVAGEAHFTHDVPAEPTIVAPMLGDEESPPVVSPVDLVVTWEPVTETVSGDPVAISGYQVIVTKVDFEDANGFSRPIYDVHVGPDTSSLPVPAGFLERDTLYELELLALEASGNQTIGLGFFTTTA